MASSLRSSARSGHNQDDSFEGSAATLLAEAPRFDIHSTNICGYTFRIIFQQSC